MTRLEKFNEWREHNRGKLWDLLSDGVPDRFLQFVWDAGYEYGRLKRSGAMTPGCVEISLDRNDTIVITFTRDVAIGEGDTISIPFSQRFSIAKGSPVMGNREV